MVAACLICGSREDEVIKMHCFPSNLERSKIWQEKLGFKFTRQSLKNYRICNTHFESEAYADLRLFKLKKHAVPTAWSKHPNSGASTSQVKPTLPILTHALDMDKEDQETPDEMKYEPKLTSYTNKLGIDGNVIESEEVEEFDIKVEETVLLDPSISYSSTFKIKEENMKTEANDEDELEVLNIPKTDNQHDEKCGHTFSVDKHVQEFCSEPDEKIDISEINLQSSEFNYYSSKSDSEHQRTFAPSGEIRLELGHSNTNHSTNIANTSSRKRLHNCHMCSFKTSNKRSLQTHISSGHQRTKMNCEFCEKPFIKKCSLDKHLLTEHEHEMDTYKKDLIKSKMSKSNTKTEKVNCRFCDRIFTFKCSLHDHLLRQHEDEIIIKWITSKIHTCNACSYKTTFKGNLNLHMASMHDVDI